MSEMSFTPFLYLLLCWSGLAAGALVVAILLGQEKPALRRANAYLAGLVVLLMVSLLFRLFYLTPWASAWAGMYLLMPPLVLAMGPCLWLYTNRLVRPERGKAKDYYHWLAPVVCFLIALGCLAWLGPEGSAYDLSLPRDRWGVVFWLFNLPILFVVPVYALACLVLLRRHRAGVEHRFSNLDGVRLRWLSVLSALWVVACFSGYLLPPEGLPRSFWFSPWAVFLIYFIGYMGARQPLVVGVLVADTAPSAEASSDQSGAQPGSFERGGDSQWQQLQQQVVTHKLYLKPNLNLAKLAEQVSLPDSQVSALINHHAGCNFFEYINRYRVEEAKRRLSVNSCEASVLDIALASGFNSKTAFYRQFKQHTGLTPTQFKQDPSLG